MKILTNNNTGKVTIIPAGITPPAWPDHTLRDVTPDVQAVIALGGPFLWVPNDAEHPDGSGELTKVEAQAKTQAECIALGEQAVANAGFSASRLVTLMDSLMQVKEANALAAHPKLVALYAWLQTVKQMAIAGSTAFPPTPHTFEEVVSE